MPQPAKLETIMIEVSPKQPLPPGTGQDTEIECDLRPLGNANHGRLKSNGDIELDQGHGPFCIQLTLKGLEWQDKDPLWVRQGQCPDSAQVASQQIWLDRKPNGKTMILLNMNVGEACDLHYRMNFKGDYYCDPIMKNGGGNIFQDNA